MKKRLNFVVLAVVVMALAMFVGCGGGANKKPDSSGNKSYSVLFVVDEKVVEKQTVFSGVAFKKPLYNTDREGYEFLGWHYENGLLVDWTSEENRKLNANTTIVAKYKANQYSIKFVMDEKQIGETQTLDYGTLLTDPAYDVQKTGYTFDGWFDSEDKLVEFGHYKVTKNMTFTAKYHVSQYNVEFIIGENQIGETQTVEHGTLLTEPTCDVQKTGYTFVGWFDSDGNAAQFGVTKIIKDLTFTARYTINEYKIRFFIGEDQIGETQNVEYDKEFTLPDVSLSDIEYVKGWKKSGEDSVCPVAQMNLRAVADVDYIAVIDYKEIDRIELKGFTTETNKKEYVVSESAEVVLHFADGTEYTLSEDEYAIDIPNDFGTSYKTYQLTVRVLIGKGGQETLSVAVYNDSKLRVLFIGNSFSDDTITLAYEVAKSAGIGQIEIADLYIGGCTIDMHVENLKSNNASYIYRCFNEQGKLINRNSTTMEYGIKDKNWDYIVLQQGSAVSGVEKSYDKIGELISYVKEKATNSDMKLMFNMTWAYKQGSANGGFKNYGNDQQTMYNAIVSAVKNRIVTNENFVKIIPNGTAIQNTRTSIVGDTLTRDDADHLTYGYGRYIAALTFVSTTTGISADKITYAPGGIMPGYIDIAKESVKNAIANPFQVTQSKITEVGDYTIGKTPIKVNFTLGYYNSSDVSLGMKIQSSQYFFATQLFTREDIPVGSIIYIAPGWKYRPEGWTNGQGNSGDTRPTEVKMEYIEVTEGWWGNYTHRGFNISKGDKNFVNDVSGDADVIKDIFKIYLPN